MYKKSHTLPNVYVVAKVVVHTGLNEFLITSVFPRTFGRSVRSPANCVTTAYGSEVPFPIPATFFNLAAYILI